MAYFSLSNLFINCIIEVSKGDSYVMISKISVVHLSCNTTVVGNQGTKVNRLAILFKYF